MKIIRSQEKLAKARNEVSEASTPTKNPTLGNLDGFKEVRARLRGTPVEEMLTSVSYSGVKLEKAKDQTGVWVPRREEFKFYVNSNHSLRLQKDIATAWRLRQSMLIEAGTSYGKTTTIEKMCAELGYEYHYVNLHEQIDVENFMGRYIPNINRKTENDPEYVFKYGPVSRGLIQEEGKVKVIVLDEINTVEGGVLKRLNEVLNAVERSGTVTLTEDSSEQIHVDREKTIIIGTMNPSGEDYHSTKPLSKELINRFLYKKLEKMTEEDIHSIIMTINGFSHHNNREEELAMEAYKEIPGIKEMIEKYAEFHIAVQKLLEKGELATDQDQKIVFDTHREPERIKEHIAEFYTGDINETMQDALDFTYLGRLSSKEDKEKVKELAKVVRVEIKPKISQRQGLEKAEVEGRDAAEFLGKFINVLDNNPNLIDSIHWNWHITNEGHVDMKVGVSDLKELGINIDIDAIEGSDQPISSSVKEGMGIKNLIKELEGKNVLSVRTGDNWRLKILPKEYGEQEDKIGQEILKKVGGRDPQILNKMFSNRELKKNFGKQHDRETIKWIFGKRGFIGVHALGLAKYVDKNYIDMATSYDIGAEQYRSQGVDPMLRVIGDRKVALLNNKNIFQIKILPESIFDEMLGQGSGKFLKKVGKIFPKDTLEKFSWTITNKGFVDMKCSIKTLKSMGGSVDKEVSYLHNPENGEPYEEHFGEIRSTGEGIGPLGSDLLNKKVVSLNSNGNWVLKIL
ncbi:MAG: AAA family ATPase [Candidatus Campbellbacteria bacterium]|nr:AAA family ATPase [Candidatus Campbellbacteria bacterium]